MHTLLLADHLTCTNEHARLARLSIALSDAGFTPVLATPAHQPAPQGVLCSTIVPFAVRGFSFSLARRAREFLDRLPDHFSLSPSDHEPSSRAVVHVLGRDAWPFAMQLRQETGVPTVFELARAADAVPLARLIRRAGHAPASIAVVAPGAAIMDRFRRLAPGVPVSIARWGVHAAASLPSLSSVFSPSSAAIFAPVPSASESDVRCVLEAFAMLAATSPDVLLFLDSRAAEHHAAWRVARRFGLLSRLTLVADAEHRAEHFLQTSLLIVPQRLAECRTLLLSAMAIGTPIIARADPDADWLVNDQTAFLVGHGASPARTPHATPADWAAAISIAVANPDAVVRLRVSAHRFVREHHTVPAYASALIDAYEACVSTAASPLTRASKA